MRKILSIIAVLACATACIYPYQPDLDEAPEGVLVVDGNLLIGETSTVQIGSMSSLWPKKNEGGDIYYYAGLSGSYYFDRSGVYVERVWAEDDAGGVYEGKFDPEYAGHYTMTPYSIPTENAPTDRKYRLCILADGLQYVSDWTQPLAAPVIKNVAFNADDKNVNVLVTLDGGPEATGYVLFSYDEAWRFHAEWYPYYMYDSDSNTVSERYFTWDRYWCWMTNNPGTQIPVDYSVMTTAEVRDYPVHVFSRYDNRNHQRYSILVKARTIDKDTYKFLSHLEESSQSGDNLFTPNPGEIAGNLRCETEPDRMVLGFVTVGGSTSFRAYNDSRFLLNRHPNPSSLSYPLAGGNRDGRFGWQDYYSWGYMPLIENTKIDYDPEKEGKYGWGPANCYDCIAAGGKLDAPDFWEE